LHEVFLQPPDLLCLDYLGLDLASVLRPEPKRHCVFGSDLACECGGGRKFWENKTGLWCAACALCEFHKVRQWLDAPYMKITAEMLFGPWNLGLPEEDRSSDLPGAV
jgi:hypothetical protein